MSATSFIQRLGRTYWILNGIEAFERLAYFGVRAVVPVFIMQADDPGGLHLTAGHKGSIYAWWFVFQSLLPTFTGGFADRYGYKKTLAVAVLLNALGYVLMAFARDIARLVLEASPAVDGVMSDGQLEYYFFFAAVMVLATGTAFFKPSLQGSLAQNLTKDISSMGWGIFYWVVNVGATIAPFLARFVLSFGEGDGHSEAHWRWLFIISAGFTLCNLLLLLTFKDVESGADKTESPWQVFKRTMVNIVEPRLVVWLLIMSCFWLMMYQLWDLHPNFITDWVDSSALAGILSYLPGGTDYWALNTARGPQVPQEILLAINAGCIVLFIIPVSWLVRKMRTLEAMMIGMGMAVGGILVAGLTGNGWILALGIVLFSLGEMLTGPKKNEYLGLIAPPGKKGLYLGYVNIPVGIGGFVGSKMAGHIYGNYGEKAVLAQKYLLEHTPMGVGKSWDGDPASLETLLGVSRQDAFQVLLTTTGHDAAVGTQLLWDTYAPHLHVWLPFAAVGVVAAVALIVFGQLAKRWKDMNA